MTSLLRTSAALFTVAALVGCASAPPVAKPDLGVGPDGCTIIDKNSGRILSMPPVECYAQRQLEAEAKTQAAKRAAEMKAMAQITTAIVKQPPSKDNPQAQNMGTVLAILKMEKIAKESGLDNRDLQDTLPGGWNKRMLEQAARLVRATFNGQCSRDITNKLDTCWEKDETPAAAPAPAAPASAPKAATLK